jgi:glycerol-3-phosphate acyltransferase PlsX
MSERSVNCTIAVDTMGSDLGPTEFIRGLYYAIEDLKLECNFILVGNERLLRRLLKVRTIELDPSRIQIHNSTQVIGMDEKPIQAIKSKKDSSMVQAVQLLKEGTAQAVLSCGNTGALMACGTLKMRPIPGIDRPALATIIPTKDKPFVLVDVGANPESTAENLVHNAVLGSNYAKAALNLKTPKVALLTIGTEEGKGNSLINEAHKRLQKINGVINYVGPIEGFQLFEGEIDVVVCDGFVGNIVLKTSEALFKFIGNTIKEELLKNTTRKIGAALTAPAFKEIKKRLGPDQHAGAPLLGLKGNILKSHGSSSFVAIGNALRIAQQVVAHDMIDSIGAEIIQANNLIKPLAVEDASTAESL